MTRRPQQQALTDFDILASLTSLAALAEEDDPDIQALAPEGVPRIDRRGRPVQHLPKIDLVTLTELYMPGLDPDGLPGIERLGIKRKFEVKITGNRRKWLIEFDHAPILLPLNDKRELSFDPWMYEGEENPNPNRDPTYNCYTMVTQGQIKSPAFQRTYEDALARIRKWVDTRVRRHEKLYAQAIKDHATITKYGQRVTELSGPPIDHGRILQEKQVQEIITQPKRKLDMSYEFAPGIIVTPVSKPEMETQ